MFSTVPFSTIPCLPSLSTMFTFLIFTSLHLAIVTLPDEIEMLLYDTEYIGGTLGDAIYGALLTLMQ